MAEDRRKGLFAEIFILMRVMQGATILVSLYTSMISGIIPPDTFTLTCKSGGWKGGEGRGKEERRRREEKKVEDEKEEKRGKERCGTREGRQKGI